MGNLNLQFPAPSPPNFLPPHPTPHSLPYLPCPCLPPPATTLPRRPTLLPSPHAPPLVASFPSLLVPQLSLLVLPFLRAPPPPVPGVLVRNCTGAEGSECLTFFFGEAILCVKMKNVTDFFCCCCFLLCVFVLLVVSKKGGGGGMETLPIMGGTAAYQLVFAALRRLLLCL